MLPVNEFNPKWDQFIPPLQHLKQYNIKENSPVGTVVVIVKAVDFDFGSDGEITYEMNATGRKLYYHKKNAYVHKV